MERDPLHRRPSRTRRHRWRPIADRRARCDGIRPEAPGRYIGKIAIVANLPYDIATLLIGWLKQIEFINQMVLMFQSEVADRLIAAGQQNVWAHIHRRPMALRVKPTFTLPARAFTHRRKSIDGGWCKYAPLRWRKRTATRSKKWSLLRFSTPQMLQADVKSLFDDPGATLEAVGVAYRTCRNRRYRRICALARAREMA